LIFLFHVHRRITVEFSLPGVEKKLPFECIAGLSIHTHSKFFHSLNTLLSSTGVGCVARRLRYENLRLPKRKMMVSGHPPISIP
jgi:hypothetical protein